MQRHSGALSCSSVLKCYGETNIKKAAKLSSKSFEMLRGRQISKRLQSRAARIVADKPYEYSATSILKELGWPSVKDIVFKEASIMTFKALKHDLSPL